MNLLRVQQKNEKKIGQTEWQQQQNRKSEKRIEQPEALISGHIPKKKVAVKEYYTHWLYTVFELQIARSKMYTFVSYILYCALLPWLGREKEHLIVPFL